jgi:hypothetical protein
VNIKSRIVKAFGHDEQGNAMAIGGGGFAFIAIVVFLVWLF